VANADKVNNIADAFSVKVVIDSLTTSLFQKMVRKQKYRINKRGDLLVIKDPAHEKSSFMVACPSLP
jgi:hypothetical protein